MLTLGSNPQIQFSIEVALNFVFKTVVRHDRTMINIFFSTHMTERSLMNKFIKMGRSYKIYIFFVGLWNFRNPILLIYFFAFDGILTFFFFFFLFVVKFWLYGQLQFLIAFLLRPLFWLLTWKSLQMGWGEMVELLDNSKGVHKPGWVGVEENYGLIQTIRVSRKWTL